MATKLACGWPIACCLLLGLVSPSVVRSASTSQPAHPSRSASPATAPDLTEELRGLEKKWLKDLGPGHAAAVKSPFLLVIDGDSALAESWLGRTVVPAAERLGKQFMKVAPHRPMVILLFSGQQGYRAACRRVFQIAEPPYFGFYRPGERTLVMDIQTGGGTLVHELTHAMIAFDFPDIPAWFNEGLGSLYEQCQYDQERIRGLVNWRLPALQKALADSNLGTLEELTRSDFRSGQVGLNYAQARYLCFYMQEQGCLERFYKAFRDNCSDDPTGLKFLRQAFEPRTLKDVETDFRRWVASLKWPGR